jgi:hypothetical protein
LNATKPPGILLSWDLLGYLQMRRTEVLGFATCNLPRFYQRLSHPHRLEMVLIESTTMVIAAAGLPLGFEVEAMLGPSRPVTSARDWDPA